MLNENEISCIWAPDEIVEGRMLDIEIFFRKKILALKGWDQNQ